MSDIKTFCFDSSMSSLSNGNIILQDRCRDDGLVVFKNMGPRTADKIRKQFSQTFEELSLKA